MNIILTLEFVPVESSQISKIGYSDEHKILAIQFIRNDALYYYKNVEKEVFERMLEAESTGKFLGSEIKGKYEYERIIHQ